MPKQSLPLNPLYPPSKLGRGLNPFLARWEGFFMSKLPLYAKIIPAYRRLSKGSTIQQKNGLRFERAVLGAILAGDFTKGICERWTRETSGSWPLASLATCDLGMGKPKNNELSFDFETTSSLITNLKTTNSDHLSTNSKQKFLVIYNPNFSYVLRNKPKLCIPDLLIFVPKSPDLSSCPGPGSIFCPFDPSVLFSKKKLKSPRIYLPSQDPLGSISLEDYSFIICMEIKLTYVEIAIEKLKKLYLPVIHQSLNLPVVPLVCVKNLTKFSPKSSSNLSSALELEIPLLTYFGNGKIY